MAGVYIHDMKMPEHCCYCRMQTDAGFCAAMPKNFCGYTATFEDDAQPYWCPLTPVHDGVRLIDAEKAKEAICRYADGVDKTKTLSGVLSLTIRDVPSVIPPETEEA